MYIRTRDAIYIYIMHVHPTYSCASYVYKHYIYTSTTYIFISTYNIQTRDRERKGDKRNKERKKERKKARKKQRNNKRKNEIKKDPYVRLM